MIEVKKNISVVDSALLSEHILQVCGKMSHLKLQKLLYYVQGFHLAYFDTHLIDDDFEAWVHGPVSRKVFNLIKDHSLLYTEVAYKPNKGQPTASDTIQKILSDQQLVLIEDVLHEYSKLSDFQLEQLTHNESPWKTARNGLAPSEKCSKIIPKPMMQTFFKTVLYGENSKTAS